ncbi:MAG TPA: flagellar hook-associated protein FlgL [Cerasibacillus sp.]|uniref:flagellar hook-associated protein FlgL n=1 Tax=Cerasibacillus sp. TaxID=2498711 RepID=UPI002F40CA1E
MRVTQNMLSNQMLRNLSSNYGKLDQYLEQLHTGKKVRRPSDNPVVAMKGMGYRAEVSKIEQFKNNASEADNWFENTDEALDKMTKALHRIYDLAVQGSTGSYNEEDRINMMSEVKQLKEHVIDIANTSVGGKYIFNGRQTDQPPVNKDGSFNNLYNNDSVMIEVAPGTKLAVNAIPNRVFNADNNDLFSTIDRFITALENSDQAQINESIGDIQTHTDQVVNARADIGARMNRLELIIDRLDHQEVVAKKMMSDNEDVDYEEVITDLITQESILRASLAAGSRTIQPTLLDFLR